MLERGEELFRHVGFGDELARVRHIAIARPDPPRRDHQPNVRPALGDMLGQGEAIHRARHVDVSEQDADVSPAFQKLERRVGILRLTTVKPAFSSMSTAVIRTSVSSSTTSTIEADCQSFIDMDLGVIRSRLRGG
jgi:hypothetical protein